MSKRKDRLFMNFKNCPICGGKNIFIIQKKKLFHKGIYIHCFKCDKEVKVKEESNE